jgi:uncharacterized membrane protein
MSARAELPDHGLEVLISALLRAGISVSLALIVAGTVVSFVHHPDYVRSAEALARLTRPGMAPRDLHDVGAGLAGLRGQALVMLGLLVLMATPVLRVAVSLVSFLRSRDRAFTLLTSAVLVLLLLSLFLGKAGG